MPDYGYTFQDLIIRVAEQVGWAKQPTVAGEVVGIPDDLANLDRVKRAINDAIGELARAVDPETRQAVRWNALMPVVSISVPKDGDGPHNAGSSGELWFTDYPSGFNIGEFFASDGTLSMPVRIRQVKELVALQNQRPQLGGIPSCMSIEGNQMVGEERGMKIRIWPLPDRDYVLTGQLRVEPATLVRLTDRSSFGAIHDQTIVAIAVWLLRRNGPDADMAARCKAQADEATLKSIRLDGEAGSVEIPPARDSSIWGVTGRTRSVDPIRFIT